MATSGGILQAPQVASHGHRWRAAALAAALVGTLWSTGFATGRLTAPDVAEGRSASITLPGGPLEHPGGCQPKAGC